MRLDLLSRILFMVYCVEAGAVFFFLPWGAAWDRTMVQIPYDGLRSALLHPTVRSLVTGFGIVHLVWAFNDLSLLLTRRRSEDTLTS